MREEYIEKIYAGWLAKMIGIRLGAPIEGWTYDKIKSYYGEVRDYPVDYREFAADDDSNGPLFFLRALEDGRNGLDVKAQDVAEALLNYAPFEHGFFWWGGYGVSTEHTAYLNLRNKIPAPRSGSMEQNGATMAEQIGGQIFIDTWGLVSPGNPDQAARFAKEAASVTHDGNGIYGGIFVAVCISYAFVEKDIHKILEKGLSYIPGASEYAKVVRAVMAFYEAHPESWRECYEYIRSHFGYDKYPGNCHIIPNIAVMILALLYGEGDFSDTLNICNMCGWDTDCNVGNVATIMGVRNGLEGIDEQKWRKPVNDLLICSSVVGSLNIMDIPYGALYIAKLAYETAGEPLPEKWEDIIHNRIDSCHFEFPGSTHAMRVRTENFEIKNAVQPEITMMNSDESAYGGSRSLKVVVNRMNSGENVYVYRKTHYVPEDFYDSRYDPCFSPLIYPGQVLHGAVYIPEYGFDAKASLYVRDAHSGEIYRSESVQLVKGQWESLTFQIPAMEGVLLDEMGICFHVLGNPTQTMDFVGFVDDLYADGQPHYTLDFAKEREEVWPGHHREISQMTKLKGQLYLAEEELHLSCADFGETYTGRYDWKDYEAEYLVTPVLGQWQTVNFRVQGAIRSYAFGFLPGHKVGILKNENGYRILTEKEFAWECGKEYCVHVAVQGAHLKAQVEECCLEVIDEERTYRTGSIGLGVREGSHIKCRKIAVKGI